MNKHRALAEMMIYNRNWLPWWLTTAVVGDFCEQAERFLRGEGLPPLPVRLWWAYKHWKFRRGAYKTSRSSLRERHKITPKTAPNPMVFSNVAGWHYEPCDIIPLAPGQQVEFIPVDNGHRIEATDMRTGERRVINVSNRMLRNTHRPFIGHDLAAHVPGLKDAALLHTEEGEFQVDVTQVRSALRESATGVVNFNGMPIARSAPIPNGIGDYPRPNCPRCHTPHPQLGTPLDPKSPTGWGDSYFTCQNMKCHHKWKWKKAFPLLEENRNKEGTATGAVIKGTDIPFHLIGKTGATIEQVNEAVRKIGNVAGISMMTPEQRFTMQVVIQESACKKEEIELAKLTNRKTIKYDKGYR